MIPHDLQMTGLACNEVCVKKTIQHYLLLEIILSLHAFANVRITMSLNIKMRKRLPGSLVVKWLSLLTLNQPSWVRIPARERFECVCFIVPPIATQVLFSPSTHPVGA